MWTIMYKGYFIHGYCDNGKTTVVEGGVGKIADCRSYRAAQLFITRIIKEKEHEKSTAQ